MSCSDPIFVPINQCEDCSSFESRMDRLEESVSSINNSLTELSSTITSLQEAITNLGASKQNNLVSGTGIKISGDTISVNNDVATWGGMHTVEISITDEKGNTETANVLEKN